MKFAVRKHLLCFYCCFIFLARFLFLSAMLLGLPFILIVLAGMPHPATATVFEFNETGEQVAVGVQTSPQPRARPEANAPAMQQQAATTDLNLSDEQKEIRALAEQIALQYSGTPGVRKVGLNAVEFAQLFTALIEQESFFDPRATSAVGAVGLGQLMPETATILGVTDPLDPVQNLNGSAHYLTTQLDRFESVELALAAYNAGPGKVIAYGGVPPFNETYEFIQRITDAAGLARPRVSEPQADPAQPDNRKYSVWEF